MNDLLTQSLLKNVSNYCKSLSDSDLAELTDFLCYGCYEREPKDWVKEFIDDFIGEKEWVDNLRDEKNPPAYFFKATSNTKEIIRLVRIDLLQESFSRFSYLLKNPLVSLSGSDKTNLKEILGEHKAMLEYQLEDEDSIVNSCEDGQELLDEKKRHLNFLGNLEI